MNPRKTALLASLGSALEYYDFVVYSLMAKYLSRLFFPEGDPVAGVIQTFAIFALGYLARPLGALIYGSLGDRLGRKKVLLLVMGSMAFATFGIGLLPPYETLGLAAPVLLALFRIIQGLSFGAELPGAITLMVESVTKRRGFYSSIIISGTSLGSLLATAFLFILTEFVPDASLLQGAWRIPFLVGGLLALICYFIRREIKETLIEPPAPCPLPLSLLLRGVGLAAFAASLIIINLYFPLYLNKYQDFDSASIYLSMTIGLLWSAIAAPLSGRLIDRLGEKKVLKIATISFLAFAYPLFALLSSKTLWALIVFMVLYQSFIVAAICSYFPLMARLFPKLSRFRGIAVCYNMTYSLVACSPVLLSFSQSSYMVLCYLLAMALGSLIASFGFK